MVNYLLDFPQTPALPFKSRKDFKFILENAYSVFCCLFPDTGKNCYESQNRFFHCKYRFRLSKLCVPHEKFSPYPKEKIRNARIQVQYTDLKMDLYLL